MYTTFMKHTLLIPILLFFTCNCFGQTKEGESFCATKENGSYFPITIPEKEFFWSYTYYAEKRIGKKKIKGKTYIEFKEVWAGGRSNSVYFRTEKGVVYQYYPTYGKETVRYDSSFKIGHTWENIPKKITYKIISFEGTLETPFCKYENLLVMKAISEKETFLFYYQRGKGYVGATKVDGTLFSYITP